MVGNELERMDDEQLSPMTKGVQDGQAEDGMKYEVETSSHLILILELQKNVNKGCVQIRCFQSNNWASPT